MLHCRDGRECGGLLGGDGGMDERLDGQRKNVLSSFAECSGDSQLIVFVCLFVFFFNKIIYKNIDFRATKLKSG